MTPTMRAKLEADYDRTAEEYLKSLPPEHFMEATPQATQRAIFDAAFEQIHALRPDIHPFSELLSQYEHGRPPERRMVVPDSMVVLYDGEVTANKSYPIALQPAGPFLVLEYVSKGSERKDYEDSFRKYERELKVPYYLLFYPDNDEMTLWNRGKRSYRTVLPNDSGRCPIPELEVEAGLVEGWVRFWFRGRMMPRPAEMQRTIQEKDRQLADLQAQLAEALAALRATQPPAP
jgi:hypothetical protein